MASFLVPAYGSKGRIAGCFVDGLDVEYVVVLRILWIRYTSINTNISAHRRFGKPVTEPGSMGERLRYVRVQRGLSLEALAERAEVSKSFLWGVENDKSGISGERLLKVANVLGASLDYLLRGERSPGMERPPSIEIPRELGELAEEHRLTYGQTLTLLEIDRSLVARRRHGGRPHMSKNDWARLYEGVKPFLEGRA